MIRLILILLVPWLVLAGELDDTVAAVENCVLKGNSRPPRMPDGALTVTLAQFEEAISRLAPKGQAIARKYFVEGLDSTTIESEVPGATRSQIADNAKTVATAVCRRFSSSGRVSVDRIWVVDERGKPLSPFRQRDRADFPKSPVEVSGSDFWEAIRSWNLTNMQIMKMRFVERLSIDYIVDTLGEKRTMVTDAVYQGVLRVKALTKLDVTIANLVVVGETSMIETNAVVVPARELLAALEAGNDPSQDAKLSLAGSMTDTPIRLLTRIVLVDEKRQPIASDQQTHWREELTTPVIHLRAGQYAEARAAMNDKKARVFDLYVRHGWSVSTIMFYLGMEKPEVTSQLAQARDEMRERLDDPKLSLTQLEVGD